LQTTSLQLSNTRKTGAQGDSVVSRLEVVDVGIDEDGEPIASCVVVPADSAGRFVAKPSGAARIALEALYEAIADFGEIGPTSSHIPPRTRTIPVVRWQDVCQAKTISDSAKPDSKRRAFVRASQKLQELKIIGVWNDRVWLTGQVGQART